MQASDEPAPDLRMLVDTNDNEFCVIGHSCGLTGSSA